MTRLPSVTGETVHTELLDGIQFLRHASTAGFSVKNRHLLTQYAAEKIFMHLTLN